jgi:dihydrofolate synthase / folylpolyglutamate synthase
VNPPVTAPPSAERADPVLDRLKRLHPRTIDLSLDRTYRLLAALGNPHRRLPPVVHVAGTNGKGSTLAYLRAFLEGAGYRVHAYTSPHLVRFHERIRLAGRLITDDHLVAVLEACEAANAGQPVTFFEATTCAAFLAFAEVPADIVLLEVGLGGRLDSTNVIDRPALTAITGIAFDHMAFLGDRIEAIAAEKAGILKPGIPAVIGPQKFPAALGAIEAIAADIDAPLFRHGREWSVTVSGDGFAVGEAGQSRRFALPRLAGRHQAENAATAIMCLDWLTGFPVPPGTVERGLQAVNWPGRLQRLERGVLAEMLPAGWELWVDAGHNADAAQALAATLADWRDKPLDLVFGMLDDRNPRDFLGLLRVRGGRTVTIADEPRALPPENCRIAAAELSLDLPVADSLADAVAQIAHSAAAPGRILITGSLALVGRALAANATVID